MGVEVRFLGKGYFWEKDVGVIKRVGWDCLVKVRVLEEKRIKIRIVKNVNIEEKNGKMLLWLREVVRGESD